MSDAEDAWVVQQYLLGRKQKEIAYDIGMSNSVVCVRIGRFTDKWSGTNVTREIIYNEHRKKHAVRALQHYLAITNGAVRPPRGVRGAQLDLWYDAPERPLNPIYRGYAYDYDDNNEYWRAREEHAWLLRAEGLKYRELAARLGCGRDRCRQLVHRFGRRVKGSLRRTGAWFHWENEKAHPRENANSGGAP